MLKVCTVYRAASIRLNALSVNLILKPISALFIQSSSHSLHFCLCISRLYFSSFLKASHLALPETHGISALLSCQAPFVSLLGHRFLPFHTPSLQSHGIAIYSHSLSLSLSLSLSHPPLAPYFSFLPPPRHPILPTTEVTASPLLRDYSSVLGCCVHTSGTVSGWMLSERISVDCADMPGKLG